MDDSREIGKVTLYRVGLDALATAGQKYFIGNWNTLPGHRGILVSKNLPSVFLSKPFSFRSLAAGISLCESILAESQPNSINGSNVTRACTGRSNSVTLIPCAAPELAKINTLIVKGPGVILRVTWSGTAVTPNVLSSPNFGHYLLEYWALCSASLPLCRITSTYEGKLLIPVCAMESCCR